MAYIELKNGRRIGDHDKPYIVAEMNSSHNGNLELAIKMVDEAKKCGCDAVKFQSWTQSSLYAEYYYKENPMAKRFVEKLSLSEDYLVQLSEYCRKIDIGFSSTPYSEEEVDYLVDKCKADFIKISSMELNNPIFLKYIGQKGVPIVLSTGMGSIEEIEYAVNTIKGTGNDKICILHCVSLYPVDACDVNLRNIRMLKDKFPNNAVGYSDHTLGYEVACAAVALGAALVEKHFTLDNAKIGWDNQMATEPGDMQALVKSCNNVFLSMGRYERVVSDAEFEQRIKMRRSIVAKSKLKRGTVIKQEHLCAKRPGNGISPDKYNELIGKILNRDIDLDERILREDLDD